MISCTVLISILCCFNNFLQSNFNKHHVTSASVNSSCITSRKNHNESLQPDAIFIDNVTISISVLCTKFTYSDAEQDAGDKRMGTSQSQLTDAEKGGMGRKGKEKNSFNEHIYWTPQDGNQQLATWWYSSPRLSLLSQISPLPVPSPSFFRIKRCSSLSFVSGIREMLLWKKSTCLDVELVVEYCTDGWVWWGNVIAPYTLICPNQCQWAQELHVAIYQLLGCPYGVFFFSNIRVCWKERRYLTFSSINQNQINSLN